MVFYELADSHDDLSQHRQRCSFEKIFENLLKLRNDEDHQKRENSDRNPEDDDRINHRGLHLPFDSDRFLHEPGETVEDDIEHPARLSGFHHVDVEPVENFRMLEETV